MKVPLIFLWGSKNLIVFGTPSNENGHALENGLEKSEVSGVEGIVDVCPPTVSYCSERLNPSCLPGVTGILNVSSI